MALAKVRLISDQLALGIRANRRPYLPQALPALLQTLLLDDLPLTGGLVCCEDPPAVDDESASAAGAPPIGGNPAADAPLSADAARAPLARALLHVVGELPLRWHTAGDLDACAGERPPHDWCVMLPVSQRVQPGVYALMALSRYRDALVQHGGPERPLVYQPLIPQILTACYHIVLLPPRAFDAQPPVTQDVYYAVALFLQLRAAYPELIQRHRGAGPLLLTPRLDTQATFAELFADIGVEGDVRYAQLDALLEDGPPLPTAVTSRHVQALRADMRAEALSHAAGLTSHSTILVYGKSGFLGLNEAGHGRSTVGLTRARGATIIMGPPGPYGLIGLVQTVLAYYYVVHSANWLLPDAPLPLCLAPQDTAAVVRPLDATGWAVPLAVQIENLRGAVVLLRLTLKRRQLPHYAFDPMSETPRYPRIMGADANQFFWA